MNNLRQSLARAVAVFYPSALVLTLLCHPVYCADAESEVQALLDFHGNQGGFVVYVGEGQDDTVFQLGKHSSYRVHGLLRNDETVVRTRQCLSDAGLCGGNRVQKWEGGDLPYIANLVSLLICENAELVSGDEALRVLSPGGLALFRDGAGWKQLQKPLNPDTDDWPQHFYDAQNNPVCKDKLVAPPRHLQWRGSPRWGRFHEKMSSFAAMVSTGGRVFYIMDHGSPSSVFFPSRWKLVARDAYNGVVLWSQPIDEWVSRFYPYKAGPATVPRRLVATDEVVYATLGIKSPVSAICARTGRILHTYEDTAYADEMILSGNLLLAVIRPSLQIPSSMENSGIGSPGRFGWQNESAKLAVIDTTTGKRIWELDTPITPLGVAADASCVYVCDWEKILCVDRLTGSMKWASKKLGIPSRYQGGLGPRLVVKDGVVLFANSENVFNRKGWAGPPDPLIALSAKNGEQLWGTEHPASGFHSPEDLFVIDGVVWFGATMDGNGKGTFTGLDLKTGALKSSFEPDDNSSYWWHQRCYPQKATEKYILTSRTGIEYVDPVAKHWELNHWVRGACTFGVIPANGLTYAPQHPCACYPESKLSGMNALAASQRYSVKPKPETQRLEKGPAFDDPLSMEAKAGPQDWPFLRGNISRSSYAPITLNGEPKQAWAVKLNSDLTSPIVAGGTIYLAEKTTDTVYALDAKSGRTRWSYTANGKVDSPPAYAYGHVVFGSRDGYVHCLNAESGSLRWRFLAAEQDKRLFNFEQLESVWPVFGSVLLLDQQICFAAGRSLFLDGGITFYKLDLATGEVLSQRRWDRRGPSGENYHAKVDRLSMPAANNDVLSSNGKHIFMSSQVVTMDGERLMTEVGARHNVDEHSHIFSPSGLLDDSWWHRSYVAYGNGVSGGAGWGSTLKAVIGAKIMCADKENIYSFGRKSKYNRWTLPLEFQLASTSKTQGKPKVKAVQDETDEKENANKSKRRKARKPTPDLSNPFRVNWSTTIPVWVKAMFVTQDKVVIAGPRDLYDEETAVASFTQNDKRFSLQQEHMEGKHGSLLKIIDKASGEDIDSVELEFMPTFDGMITAEGKIFMTTSDGRVVCFEF